MAHLPSAELKLRHEAIKKDIIEIWSENQGQMTYIIQCPCRPSPCTCMEPITKLVLVNCPYVGKLDQFYVEQPLIESQGFRVTWLCEECQSEFACGMPM